jgi:hypothetical protein
MVLRQKLQATEVELEEKTRQKEINFKKVNADNVIVEEMTRKT